MQVRSEAAPGVARQPDLLALLHCLAHSNVDATEVGVPGLEGDALDSVPDPDLEAADGPPERRAEERILGARLGHDARRGGEDWCALRHRVIVPFVRVQG